MAYFLNEIVSPCSNSLTEYVTVISNVSTKLDPILFTNLACPHPQKGLLSSKINDTI